MKSDLACCSWVTFRFKHSDNISYTGFLFLNQLLFISLHETIISVNTDNLVT